MRHYRGLITRVWWAWRKGVGWLEVVVCAVDRGHVVVKVKVT